MIDEKTYNDLMTRISRVNERENGYGLLNEQSKAKYNEAVKLVNEYNKSLNEAEQRKASLPGIFAEQRNIASQAERQKQAQYEMSQPKVPMFTPNIPIAQEQPKSIPEIGATAPTYKKAQEYLAMTPEQSAMKASEKFGEQQSQNYFKILGRALNEGNATFWGNSLASVANMIGREDLATKATQAVNRMSAEQGIPQDLRSFKISEDWYKPNKLVYQGVGMLPYSVNLALANIVAAPFKPVGLSAKAYSYAVTALSTALAESGGSYGELKQRADSLKLQGYDVPSDEELKWISFGVGAVNGALEAGIGIEGKIGSAVTKAMLGKTVADGTAKVLARNIKNITLETLKNSTGESVEEMLQQVSSNLGSKVAFGKKGNTLLDGVAESGYLAFLSSMPMSAGLATVETTTKPTDQKIQPKQEQQPVATQQNNIEQQPVIQKQPETITKQTQPVKEMGNLITPLNNPYSPGEYENNIKVAQNEVINLKKANEDYNALKKELADLKKNDIDKFKAEKRSYIQKMEKLSDIIKENEKSLKHSIITAGISPEDLLPEFKQEAVNVFNSLDQDEKEKYKRNRSMLFAEQIQPVNENVQQPVKEVKPVEPVEPVEPVKQVETTNIQEPVVNTEQQPVLPVEAQQQPETMPVKNNVDIIKSAVNDILTEKNLPSNVAVSLSDVEKKSGLKKSEVISALKEMEASKDNNFELGFSRNAKNKYYGDYSTITLFKNEQQKQQDVSNAEEVRAKTRKGSEQKGINRSEEERLRLRNNEQNREERKTQKGEVTNEKAKQETKSKQPETKEKRVQVTAEQGKTISSIIKKIFKGNKNTEVIYTNNAYALIEEGETSFALTNGKVVYEVKAKNDYHGEKKEIVFPIKNNIDILKDGFKVLNIYENNIIIEDSKGKTHTFPKIQGIYPVYRVVFSKEHENKIKINIDEFVNDIKENGATLSKIEEMEGGNAYAFMYDLKNKKIVSKNEFTKEEQESQNYRIYTVYGEVLNSISGLKGNYDLLIGNITEPIIIRKNNERIALMPGRRDNFPNIGNRYRVKSLDSYNEAESLISKYISKKNAYHFNMDVFDYVDATIKGDKDGLKEKYESLVTTIENDGKTRESLDDLIKKVTGLRKKETEYLNISNEQYKMIEGKEYRVANESEITAKPQERETASKLSKALTGKEVIYVDLPRNTDGFINPDGQIYINKNAVNPVDKIIRHEAVHYLRDTNPEMFYRAKRFINEYLMREGLDYNYALMEELYPNKSKDYQEEEQIAFFIAENMANKAFWDYLLSRDKPFFSRLFYQLKYYAMRMARTIKGSLWGDNMYKLLLDLEKVLDLSFVQKDKTSKVFTGKTGSRYMLNKMPDKKQKSDIHIKMKQLGFGKEEDEQAYKTKLKELSGQESTLDMSYEEASVLIEVLNQEIRKSLKPSVKSVEKTNKSIHHDYYNRINEYLTEADNNAKENDGYDLYAMLSGKAQSHNQKIISEGEKDKDKKKISKFVPIQDALNQFSDPAITALGNTISQTSSFIDQRNIMIQNGVIKTIKSINMKYGTKIDFHNKRDKDMITFVANGYVLENQKAPSVFSSKDTVDILSDYVLSEFDLNNMSSKEYERMVSELEKEYFDMFPDEYNKSFSASDEKTIYANKMKRDTFISEIIYDAVKKQEKGSPYLDIAKNMIETNFNEIAPTMSALRYFLYVFTGKKQLKPYGLTVEEEKKLNEIYHEVFYGVDIDTTKQMNMFMNKLIENNLISKGHKEFYMPSRMTANDQEIMPDDLNRDDISVQEGTLNLKEQPWNQLESDKFINSVMNGYRKYAMQYYNYINATRLYEQLNNYSKDNYNIAKDYFDNILMRATKSKTKAEKIYETIIGLTYSSAIASPRALLSAIRNIVQPMAKATDIGSKLDLNFPILTGVELFYNMIRQIPAYSRYFRTGRIVSSLYDKEETAIAERILERHGLSTLELSVDPNEMKGDFMKYVMKVANFPIKLTTAYTDLISRMTVYKQIVDLFKRYVVKNENGQYDLNRIYDKLKMGLFTPVVNQMLFSKLVNDGEKAFLEAYATEKIIDMLQTYNRAEKALLQQKHPTMTKIMTYPMQVGAKFFRQANIIIDNINGEAKDKKALTQALISNANQLSGAWASVMLAGLFTSMLPLLSPSPSDDEKEKEVKKNANITLYSALFDIIQRMSSPAYLTNFLLNQFAGFQYSDYGINEILSLGKQPIALSPYKTFEEISKSENKLEAIINKVPTAVLPFLKPLIQTVGRYAYGLSTSDISDILKSVFTFKTQKQIADALEEKGLDPNRIHPQYRKAIGIDLYVDAMQKKSSERKFASTKYYPFVSGSSQVYENLIKLTTETAVLEQYSEQIKSETAKAIIDERIAQNKRKMLITWSRLPRTQTEIEKSSFIGDNAVMMQKVRSILSTKGIDKNALNDIFSEK